MEEGKETEGGNEGGRENMVGIDKEGCTKRDLSLSRKRSCMSSWAGFPAMGIRLQWLLHLPGPKNYEINSSSWGKKMLMGSSRGRTIACGAYYARLHWLTVNLSPSLMVGASTATQAMEEGTRHPMTRFLSWAYMALDWTVSVTLSSW